MIFATLTNTNKVLSLLPGMFKSAIKDKKLSDTSIKYMFIRIFSIIFVDTNVLIILNLL